ncbi:MAG TPA: hypothetical protein VNU92_18145 [Edaphobacter sp.]|nr:hypothetical protein [Edaphobacter sp.]
MSIDAASKTTEDFLTQYQVLSDESLTQLAAEGGLRQDADIALKAEMRRRSMGANEIKVLRERQEKTRLQMMVGHNPYDYRGSGLQLRGNKFLGESDRHRAIATVTRWIVFLSMPTIPIGSYRVKKHLNAKPEIIGKVPLQWDQVFEGWKKAATIVLGIVGVMIGVVLWERLQGR